MGDAIFGHAATIERRVSGGGILETEEIAIRRQGPERVIRRAAKFTRGFVRVVSVEPFTKEQWLRCFGRGRM